MDDASPLPRPPRLCARCSELDLWQPDLRFTVTLSILLSDGGCQLCSLIKDCLSDLALPDYVDEITIQRNGPTLEVEPGNRSILSFYDHPGKTYSNIFNPGS